MRNERHEAFQPSDERLLFLLAIFNLNRAYFHQQLKVGDWVSLFADKESGFKVIAFEGASKVRIQKWYPTFNQMERVLPIEKICPFNAMSLVFARYIKQ